MAARGDRAAYGRLYREYFPVVTDYISKLDGQSNSPEDLAQEVFGRVWQSRTRYRLDSAVRTYLFGVAKNVLPENQHRTCRQIKLQTCLKASHNVLGSRSNSQRAAGREQLEDARSIKWIAEHF